jgi:predicted dithiol-disulfide oxidoreductase (DUF899 family)
VSNASAFKTDFAWYVDGNHVSDQTTFQFSKPANNFSLGRHSLTVIATDAAGKEYSETVLFTNIEEAGK